MKQHQKNLWTRVIAMLVCLGIIFFLGRQKNDQGKNSLTLTPNGVSSYRLGMDVAGGTRLTYKINYDKYRQLYTDQYQFNQARKDAENVILQQIDSRISKLGVSDYAARPVKLNDEYYLQIDLGGVQDIEEAKAIIGKTVELEFKLQSKVETGANYASRKARATTLLEQAIKNPTLFKDLAQGKKSEDIIYTSRPSTSQAQLPSIYKTIDLDAMQTGAVYPSLLEGVYQDFSPELEAQGYQDIRGFTLMRLIDKKIQQLETISAQQFAQYASTADRQMETQIVKDEPAIAQNQLSHDATTNTLTYNAGPILDGQVGYELTLYQGTGDATQLLAQAQQTGSLTPEYEGWIDAAQLQQLMPAFVYATGQQRYSSSSTGASIVAQIQQMKPANEPRYSLLSIRDIAADQVEQIKQTLTNQKLYTIEEIFVNEKNSWITATDPKTGEPLDAKHFEIARSSADQLGNQVTSITFNEEGKRLFCNITEANIKEQLAIFVGGELVSAPVIQDKICGGETIINGDFTGQTCYRKDGSTYAATDHKEGVQCMVENLNEGALPAQLILTQEEKVSPSLGNKSLKGVIYAGLLGFAAIFVYMLMLYGWRKALVSLLVLVSFMIILLAILKLMGYVISMSSLAALILTIGMSVDATILIYERVIEERKKQGLVSAVIDGAKRSRPAIRDGNLSTGLIAFLLFTMGVNIFKGFGSMMIITIIIILLVIVPLTKTLLLRLSKKDD